MIKTAMGDAFNRAGIDGVKERLCTDAIAMLRRHGTPERALSGFLDRLKISPEVRELLGMAIIREKAMELLLALAADMQATALKKVPASDGGAAHSISDSQPGVGRTETSTSVPAQAGGAALSKNDSHGNNGRTESSEGEKAQSADESHQSTGASFSDTNERGAAQKYSDSQGTGGRSVLTAHHAGKPRGLEAMRMAARAAPQYYVRTSNGRIIETMRGGEIDTLLAGSARDVALARFVKSHGVPVNILVGDIISKERLAVYDGWANEFAGRITAMPPIGLDEFFNQKLVNANG